MRVRALVRALTLASTRRPQDVTDVPLPPQLRELPSFAFLKEPLQLTAPPAAHHA